MSSPSLPGDRRRPAAEIDPALAQIEAEIGDHLATSAENLAAAGVAPEEAQRQTREKFGDARAIGRRCWWIQQGDSFMFRVTLVSLIVVLCLALGITTLGSWQSQSRMADQMNALSEQLQALAERPSPAPAAPQPLEISGQVYLGETNRPAAGVEVKICRAGDGQIVRRVATDEQGRYRSGPLTAGDYTLVTALVGNAPYPDMGVQSGPLYLYPGAGSATCDLNAAYQGGRLALELPRPLAPLVVDDRYRIEQRLLVVVRLAGIRYLRWTTAADMPPSWPLYLRMPSVAASGNSSSESPRFWELLGEQDVSNQLHGTQFLGQEGHIPAGKCTVSAVVLADVLPAGMTPPTTDPNLVGYPPIPDSDPNLSTGPYRLRFPGSVGFDDAWTWYRKVFGAHWYRQLQPSTPREFAPDEGARSFLSFNLGLAGGRRDASEVPIQGGQVTRLRLTIPDDFLTRIRQIVDSAETAAAFADKTRQGDNPFVKRVQIEVAGFEPLETESAAPGTSELAQ